MWYDCKWEIFLQKTNDVDGHHKDFNNEQENSNIKGTEMTNLNQSKRESLQHDLYL